MPMILACLQYLQALAVVAIAAIGAWLAWQQVQIARIKLQHDLYDRRYRVFDATRKLVLNICVNRTASEEDTSAFRLGTGDAAFLFDDDLAKYLEQMSMNAFDIYLNHRVLKNTPMGEQRTKAVTDIRKHLVWFDEQLDSITDKFKPFLKLDR
jgi:hypothetical protein